MSTANLLNSHFEDSDDEEDFNPQPADLSDNEDAGGSDHDDAGDQIRNEAARQPSRDDASEADSTTEPVRSKTRDAELDGDEEIDDEDAEGEGEDTGPRANDDDEEDEEEDDEEEITVRNSRRLSPEPLPVLHTDFISGPPKKAKT